MPPEVSPEEFAWREWVLGEGRFRERGPRDAAARAETGAPDKIPPPWWERLEGFVARRHEGKEPRQSPPMVRRILVAVRAPTRRVDDEAQLSPHFNVDEFNCKDGTRVPKASVPALTRLCNEVLEPLREQFGSCTIMSGYRPTAYNTRIGGAKFSQHIYDLHPDTVAADLTFERGRPSDWADAAESLCERGGLGRYPGFVHVDNRGTNARWSG
jgi:hypothetical protein